jgi:hypothetical protein
MEEKDEGGRRKEEGGIEEQGPLFDSSFLLPPSSFSS